MKTSLKASLVAAAIAALPLGAQAAGLGSLNVFSGLGQPLRAEIELNATPHELESLTAKIASAEAFRQAGLTYSAVMPALRLAVERRGNAAVLRLTSDRPLNEPFVDLLLDLGWASGRLIREYTFLLDPAPLNAPAPVAAGVTAPPVSSGRSARQRSGTDALSRQAAAERYEVRRGDTLHSIAAAHRPRGATLEQMLIALFRTNAAAFDGANINRLRAGSVLNLPAPSDVASIAPARARREVMTQSADFDAYRSRLAGVVAGSAASAESEPTRADAGRVTPKVEEAGRAATEGDRVEVSSSADAAKVLPADGEGLSRLHSLEEDLLARDKALEEANARLAALEASIREMQQLLAVRGRIPAPQQPDSVPQEGAAGTPPVSASGSSSDARSPTASGKAASDETRSAAGVAAPAAATHAPPARSEADAVDGLLDDPKLLAGGGGIVLLLLAYLGIKLRQRRLAGQELDDARAGTSGLTSEMRSTVGTVGGQSVDTTEISLLQSDFSQSDFSVIDANEGVDPVAEADVYMAYGRDAQAEEILLDALEADSSRTAISLKLLEIYARRNAVKPFEDVASDLRARTGGAGAEWETAAELGRRVDPGNPLYRVPPEPVPGAAAGLRQSGAASFVGAAVLARHATAPGGEAVQTARDARAALIDLDFGTHVMDGDDTARVADEVRLPRSAVNVQMAPARETDGLPDLAGFENARPSPRPEVAAGLVPDALPEIDSSALDFGLDRGTDNATPAATALPPAAEALPDAPDPHALEFDFQRAGDPAPMDESPRATVIGKVRAFAGDDGDSDEEPGRGEPLPQPALADLELSATEVGPELFSGHLAPELEETTFDTSFLDFDFNFDEPQPEASPVAAAPTLDFSDLELDAPGADAETQRLRAPGATADLNDGDCEEAGTKLELARVYVELGDRDGARELIGEVLREGSAEQKEAARRLIDAAA